MQLNDALNAIAQQFDLPGHELIAYAAEDPHDGWDLGRGSWVSGSVWTVEGKVLYAMVRALKPQEVIEFGTAHGCSSTHIAQALADNGSGHLTCVDRNDYAGLHIPDELRDKVRIVVSTVYERLQHDNAIYDFVFEDADHRPAPVGAVWQWARKHVRQGGAVVSHDPLHPTTGKDVSEGIVQSGAQNVVNYLVEPGDGGLAIWRQDEQIEAAQPADAKVQEPKRPAKKNKGTRKRGRAFKTDERQPAPDEREVGEAEPAPDTAATGLRAD